jgi:hypothetical protein
VQIELLYFDGCPNWRVAAERVREALVRLGRADVPIVRTKVASVEEAAVGSFRGSPTILVDGRDPFADPGAPVGLSCRVYVTDVGLAGAPTVDQLVEVLDG